MKVSYKNIDIEKDAPQAKVAADISGQVGVPVTDINGTIIVGFDRARIKEELTKNKLI